MNYPGFSDPKIHISTRLDASKVLIHDADVRYHIDRGEVNIEVASAFLPEKYNGLGYQNLISMVFNLIRFRDEWMRVGKAGKRDEMHDDFIEPLHIVLIEEPEAHLHAQAQQVFVKKAYDVLRKHDYLGTNPQFATQLLISTHSSHIAHEIDFASLRYFKRKASTNICVVPCAEVVNLSSVFGIEDDTARFAKRYLKTTHCDLFFADAVILVEGPAERMLVPFFIKNNYSDLDRCYLSILEIGGSHAHRLRPLIEKLGLFTLIITDLDSIKSNSTSKTLPKKGEGLRTGNDTLKTWIPERTTLDDVLNAAENQKVKDEHIRVAYQHEMKVKFAQRNITVIPYTFEDALVFTNLEFFRKTTVSNGLIKKMRDAVSQKGSAKACKDMFDALGKNSKKAEMALELLYITEPNRLSPPKYIAEGLEWLQNELTKHKSDYILENSDNGGGGVNV